MAEDRLEKSALVKFSGLALGILIGGPIGPIVFTPLRLGVPAAATAGSFVGAILGYAVTAALVAIEKHRRDRELEEAANAVKREASLPDSILLKVRDMHLTLEGEVENPTLRQKAAQVLSTVPGIKSITNRIRLKSSAAAVTASPDEISQQIRERLVKRAELDSKGIHIVLNNSRVVLEGTVSSWSEASEAEQVVWNIPGVEEVENRLEIAA
jgi:osmotically-inducible protein OsmY